MYYMSETSMNKLENHSVSKILLTFNCVSKLYLWYQNVCKFLDFSLEFQKVILVTRTIFSHSRSEQI